MKYSGTYRSHNSRVAYMCLNTKARTSNNKPWLMSDGYSFLLRAGLPVCRWLENHIFRTVPNIVNTFGLHSNRLPRFYTVRRKFR
jgi:hypothetical protein